MSWLDRESDTYGRVFQAAFAGLHLLGVLMNGAAVVYHARRIGRRVRAIRACGRMP